MHDAALNVRALRRDVGVGGLCLSLGEGGLRAIERGAQRRRVDLKERLSFLDLRAFRIEALLQYARHARAHVRGARGREPPDKTARQGHRLGVGEHHRDLGQGRGRRGLTRAARGQATD